MQLKTITPEEFFNLSIPKQHKLIRSSDTNSIMTFLWTIEGEREFLRNEIEFFQKLRAFYCDE